MQGLFRIRNKPQFVFSTLRAYHRNVVAVPPGLVRSVRAPVVPTGCVCAEVQMWESLNSGEAHQWAKAHFYFEAKMALDLDKIREICDRVSKSLGLELVDVEFKGGAGKQGRLLRIVIDKPSAEAADGAIGVSHEDCANVSREVGTILDVEDAVSGGDYLLEVSSPGLDRKLSTPSDFERFTGSRVKLMTHEPVGVTDTSKGNRHFEGRLAKFEDNRLTLDTSSVKGKTKKQKQSQKQQKSDGAGNEVIIELANIEKANLVPEI
jgi:ribosome maturation factor RimP